MGGADTTQAQQTQQTTQLPPWVNTAAQQNYAQAQNIAATPLQQYQGQLVPNMAPQTQQAINTAASGGSAGADQYNAAQAGYLGVMGQQPQQVQAGQLSNTNLQPYMNPYTQSVINSTLPIMQQNLGLQQIGNQSQAAGANAYGGSRMGIQQGITQSQGAMNMANMAAQLNQANFGQAQGAAQSDISTNLQAQLANQQAQQNQGGLNNQAAAGLANLGNQAQLSQARNFTEQASAGGLEQAQAQSEIQANLNQYNQALQYPYQQLGVLQSALGQTPYGQSITGASTTQTQTASNPLTMALGGLTSLGSLFGSSGALGGINPYSSDRKLKTDIKKIDTHPTGLPIYSYRYKGDPKHYPKVAGPMAEDVAKIAPHAVRSVGVKGRKAVDMNVLDALTPRAPFTPGGLGPAARAGLGPRPGGYVLPSPIPGPLSARTPIGGVGALGASMMGAPGMRRRLRPPQIRGALGG